MVPAGQTWEPRGIVTTTCTVHTEKRSTAFNFQNPAPLPLPAPCGYCLHLHHVLPATHTDDVHLRRPSLIPPLTLTPDVDLPAAQAAIFFCRVL